MSWKAKKENENAIITARMLKWIDWKEFLYLCPLEESTKAEYDLKGEISQQEDFQTFPVGSYDLLKCNELWKMILAHIKIPSDMSSASQACSYFGNLLEERILQEVFKILRDKNFISVEYREKKGTSFIIRPILKSILKLRLVSKTWKRVVETTYLDGFQGNWKLKFLHASTSAAIDLMKLNYIFRLDLDYVSRLSWNDIHCRIQMDRNNWLMKTVYVKDWYPYMESFYDRGKPNLLRLLRLHGKFVRGLFFDTSCMDSSVGKYLSLLRLLRKLPELKALVLTMNTIKYSTNSNTFVEGKGEAEELRKCIRENPLPVMVSVEVVKFASYMEHVSVVLEILRKCPNAKSLQLPCNQIISDHCHLVTVLENLELQHLKVQRPHLIQVDSNYSTGQFELLHRVKWPLKSLVLSHPVFYDNDELFLIINRLGEHLENLDLENYVRPKCRQHCLKLPCLKRLRFGCASSDESLDYIVNLKRLEHLEFGILLKGSCDSKFETLLQFAGHISKREESNILEDIATLENRYNSETVKYMQSETDIVKSVKSNDHNDRSNVMVIW